MINILSIVFAMALTPPAKHRKVWYRVANSLGAEDRKSISFLLDINEVESGLDLFRILESKKFITASDPYSQLVPLLHDVGRNDIITEIYAMDPTACGCLQLEYHASFSGSEQLARIKRCTILCKRDEYIFCAKELKEVRSCIQSRRVCCEGLFNPIFSQVTLQPESSESAIDSMMRVKSVENAIIALSLFWQMWPKALARFQGTCSSLKIKHLMEQCHQQFDQFYEQTKLDCASEIRTEVQRSSQEKSNHPIGQVARRVHHALDEISSEMFGNQKTLSIATSSTKNAIFTVESINYTTKYIFPIFKWLAFLLHAVGLGKLNVQSIKNTLESVVSDHKVEIGSNWEAISSILGDHLSSKLRDLIPVTSATQKKDKEECAGNAYDGLTHAYLTETLGIVWYTVLIILAGIAAGRIHLFTSEFTVQQLQQKIFQHLNAHKHKLVHVHHALSVQMGNSMQQEIQMFKGHLVEVVRMMTNGQPDSAKLMDSIFEEDQDEEIP